MDQHHHHALYRLTSLQIGDIQSYLSRLFLLMVPSKLVFLVDNGPWSNYECRSKPAELWQLMVTQSRASPFANHKLRRSKRKITFPDKEDTGSDTAVESSASAWSQAELVRFRFNTAKYSRWKSLINDVQQKCNPSSFSERLASEFNGCVAFEVCWSDVRGMNYLNELQADTCMALEVKVLIKREFDTLDHALTFYGSTDACFGQKKVKKPEMKCKKSVAFVDDSIHEGNNSHLCILKHGSLKQSEKFSSEKQEGRTESNLGCNPPSPFDCDLVSPSIRKSEAIVQHNEGFHACDHNSIEFVDGLDSFPCLPQGVATPNNCCSNHLCKHVSNEDPYMAIETLAKANEDSVFTSRENPFDGSNMMEHFSAESLRDSSKGCNCCISAMSQQVGSCADDNLMGKKRLADIGDGVQCNSAASVFRDAFVLFRFSDPFLPFQLQEIITSDQRLLKMLESGLPPWVMFLQSYPIFCKLYRPWMRPLVLTIYFLVSLVTVLIGFYDLYKNVPILKATVAHMFGPLFEWVETWEMVSRLKYLGTMLVLQNYEKALEWTLLTLRGLRRLILLITQPVIEPITLLAEYCLPAWTGSMEWTGILLRVVSTFLQSVWVAAGSLLNVLIWPICICLSSTCNLGVFVAGRLLDAYRVVEMAVIALLYPIFSTIWLILTLPYRIICMVIEIASFLFLNLFDVLYRSWKGANQAIQLYSASETAIGSTVRSVKLPSQTTSVWRATWDDLFSKVFRALRYIVNGFVAFFSALNRHRLSIYNNLRAFLIYLSHIVKSGQLMAKKLSERIFMRPALSQESSEDQCDKKTR